MMDIQVWLFVVILIVILVVGGLLGFYLSQRYTKKYLEENPPLNEKMIRFSYHQDRRITNGKQVKDGAKGVIIHTVFPALVVS